MTQVLQEAARDLMRHYTQTLERRLANLILAGISIDRMQFVTRADCAVCRGTGYVFTSEGFVEKKDAYEFSLSECPLCPGLTITE